MSFGLGSHISGFDDIALFPPRPLDILDQLPATLLPDGVGHFQSTGRQSANIFGAQSLPFVASAEEG